MQTKLWLPVFTSVLLALVAAASHAEPDKEQTCLVCHNVMDEIEAGHEDCASCHGDSERHTQRQPGGPWPLPAVTFDSDTPVVESNQQCTDCHEMTADVLDKQPPMQQSYHHTGMRRNLSCVGCHQGIAHGLPDWVIETRD